MRRVSALLAVGVVFLAGCKDDKPLVIVNECGTAIEFYPYEDAGDGEFNAETRGDIFRLGEGATLELVIYTDVDSIEIYSRDLDLVLSASVADVPEARIVIGSGCDQLASLGG